MMRAIFVHPIATLCLIAVWLILQHSMSLANILLAVVLATVVPYIFRYFFLSTPNINAWMVVKLIGVVLWDIVLCNIRVTYLLLNPKSQFTPQWFRVPLETEHQHVNSLLAMIITMTPGTVTAGVDLARKDILVHALSTTDTQAEIDAIKQRYEAALIRVFDAKPTESTICP